MISNTLSVMSPGTHRQNSFVNVDIFMQYFLAHSALDARECFESKKYKGTNRGNCQLRENVVIKKWISYAKILTSTVYHRT